MRLEGSPMLPITILPPCSGTEISAENFSDAKTALGKESKMSKSIAASGNADTRPRGERAAQGPFSTPKYLSRLISNAFFFIERSISQFTSLENHTDFI